MSSQDTASVMSSNCLGRPIDAFLAHLRLPGYAAFDRRKQRSEASDCFYLLHIGSLGASYGCPIE